MVKHIHKWLTELVWFSRVTYIDGTNVSQPVKVPTNMMKTSTGYMNGYLFTLKDAHYAAFGFAGFGVKSVELSRGNIKYCEKTMMYEVL